MLVNFGIAMCGCIVRCCVVDIVVRCSLRCGDVGVYEVRYDSVLPGEMCC